MSEAQPGGGAIPGPVSRRLTVHTLGFLRAARVRRMLALGGWRVSFGWPGKGDSVGVWGQRPVSARGRWIARRSGCSVLTVEDGFLRSVYPGVTGAPPISIVLDDLGIYYDASAPSRLEALIEADAWDQAVLDRAEAGIARLRAARLSKYTPPGRGAIPESGFVLVVDQTVGDASIGGAGALAATFARMIEAARLENPGRRIVVKSHPDVIAGAKRGHIAQSDLEADDLLFTATVNPWDLIEAAAAVYTVSSQMGYEALLAGKQVRTFGAAFYAGWGLTEDEATVDRRSARPDVRALFAACHLDYPIYYDPWRDCLTEFETAVDVLSAERDAETPCGDTKGDVLHAIRLWKRRNVAAFRPRRSTPVRFEERADRTGALAKAENRAIWAWASKVAPDWLDQQRAAGLEAGLIEDGFLRSVGLGAQLTWSASLVFDRQGIYFDPARPSDLETLISQSVTGSPDTATPTAVDLPRAAALRSAILAAGVTKYNVGHAAPVPDTADRRVILVPGQVEDDASILRGCGTGPNDVRTNLGLLKATRDANPDSWIIYKPHPDVETGLRPGGVDPDIAAGLADEIASGQGADGLMHRADEVWTLTSLMGFEALMRGCSVTCLGTPFYAGWGLTNDLAPPCHRRTARPTLDHLVWAALIAYPRYVDPVSGLPCTPELIVERLASGAPMPRARLLSRIQGLFAGQSWLWR